MDPVTLILILFVAALVLFATEWLPVDVTALALLSALLLAGLVTPGQAFAGFGSDTVLTLASLFILTRVLLRAGVIEWIGVSLARRARNAPAMLRGLLGTVAGISAFTSNTATTAVFLPVVAGLAKRTGLGAGRALMPLAFASILGGTVTVIGTSTNLVVSGALPTTGQAPLGFFELAWVGLPVAVVGLLYLFLVAPRLLPNREAALEDSLRAYLADLTVAPGSPLATPRPGRCRSCPRWTRPTRRRRRRPAAGCSARQRTELPCRSGESGHWCRGRRACVSKDPSRGRPTPGRCAGSSTVASPRPDGSRRPRRKRRTPTR